MIIIPILIYILCLLIIFIIKPSIFFDKNGNIKNYNSKAMITIDLIYPILAIISYYIYIIIKVMNKK
jgi:hypothetical protein